MFTLVILDLDGSVAIKGQSEPGENWEVTLIRLFRQMVKDKDRRVLDRPHYGAFEDLAARGTGRGVAVVGRLEGPSERAVRLKEYVRFETYPPQF